MPGPKKPCGRRFCAAAYRIVWAEDDWTMDQAAAAIGHCKTSIHRAGEMLDLPPRPRSRPAKRLSRHSVLKAWMSEDMDTLTAAASIGVAAHVLRYHAMKVYKLGPKPVKGADLARTKPCRWFRHMWDFNVSAASIADHMGCKESTVHHIAERLKLKKGRPYKRGQPKPTVADFIEHELPRLLLRRAAMVESVAPALRHRATGENLAPMHIQAVRRILEERGAA